MFGLKVKVQYMREGKERGERKEATKVSGVGVEVKEKACGKVRESVVSV